MNGSIAILCPILVGLLQALKAVPGLKKRLWLLPLLAVVLGVALAYAVEGFPASTGPLLSGLMVGLAACGLYDVGKGVLAGAAGTG